MQRTILLQGRPVTYELTRKRVKNVNIRVRADGTVGVSAPHRVTDQQVEEILTSRAAFIRNALERFSALDQQPPSEPTYAQDETIWLLGREYGITLRKGPKNQAWLEGATLCLSLKDPEDPALRKKTVEEFYKAQCLAVTTELCRQGQARMAPLGVPFPVIKVRSMTSRWGSCKPSDGKVTFAWQLMEAPLACVEYVVYHELVHFLHLNHAPAFYRCLEEFLPDWKARRDILNSRRYRAEAP